MRITGDYHTHTKFSHGMGSIEENIISAISKGLDVICISDHGPSFLPYGIVKDDYYRMRLEVDRLLGIYGGKIKILLGIEANIMDSDGNLDIDDEMLEYCDMLLVGFHYDIIYRELIEPLRKSSRRGFVPGRYTRTSELLPRIISTNTSALIKCLGRYQVDILTHLSDEFPVDISKVIPYIVAKDTLIELNNFHRPISNGDMSMLLATDKISFVINSDAHRPSDVGNISIVSKRIKKSSIPRSRIINC